MRSFCTTERSCLMQSVRRMLGLVAVLTLLGTVNYVSSLDTTEHSDNSFALLWQSRAQNDFLGAASPLYHDRSLIGTLESDVLFCEELPGASSPFVEWNRIIVANSRSFSKKISSSARCRNIVSSAAATASQVRSAPSNVDKRNALRLFSESSEVHSLPLSASLSSPEEKQLLQDRSKNLTLCFSRLPCSNDVSSVAVACAEHALLAAKKASVQIASSISRLEVSLTKEAFNFVHIEKAELHVTYRKPIRNAAVVVALNGSSDGARSTELLVARARLDALPPPSFHVQMLFTIAGWRLSADVSLDAQSGQPAAIRGLTWSATDPSRQATKDIASVHLVSYNIWNYMESWDQRQHMIATLINNMNPRPDAIGWQEVRERWNEPLSNQLHVLASLIPGYQWWWKAAMNHDGESSSEGLGFFVRDGISVSDIEHWPLSYNNCTGDLNTRLLFHCRLQLDDTERTVVQFFDTHWSYSHSCQMENAYDSWNAMKSTAFSTHRVCVGDYNIVPAFEEPMRFLEGLQTYRSEKGDFEDAWTKLHGSANGDTFPSWQPKVRPDRVLVASHTGAKVTPLSLRTFGGTPKPNTPLYASDHLGLVTSLALEPQ